MLKCAISLARGGGDYRCKSVFTVTKTPTCFTGDVDFWIIEHKLTQHSPFTLTGWRVVCWAMWRVLSFWTRKKIYSNRKIMNNCNVSTFLLRKFLWFGEFSTLCGDVVLHYLFMPLPRSQPVAGKTTFSTVHFDGKLVLVCLADLRITPPFGLVLKQTLETLTALRTGGCCWQKCSHSGDRWVHLIPLVSDKWMGISSLSVIVKSQKWSC